MEDWQSIVKENEMKRIAKFMFDGDKDVELTDKYHYHITAHFSKAKQQDAEYCFKHFRNVLDNKVVGRRNRLYKACFIEEGKNHLSKSYNDRHCHLLIQKPKHLTKKKYEEQFNELWQNICGNDNIKWTRIEKQKNGIDGVVDYLTKELEFGHKAFIEDLSDNASKQKNRKQ